MTDLNKPATPENWLEEPKKRPDTLNVISILTFVGSGIAILGQIYSFFKAQSTYEIGRAHV